MFLILKASASRRCSYDKKKYKLNITDYYTKPSDFSLCYFSYAKISISSFLKNNMQMHGIISRTAYKAMEHLQA